MKTNNFVHKIAKDLVHWLPITQFDGEVFVIDHPEQVASAVAYLKAQKIVGVDTESRPSFKRGVHYPTALLQIATEERCYLFRLTAIGLPEEVAQLFSDNNIIKVGLAFKDDLNGLKRLRDFKPRNCIDLQSIVGRY